MSDDKKIIVAVVFATTVTILNAYFGRRLTDWWRQTKAHRRLVAVIKGFLGGGQ